MRRRRLRAQKWMNYKFDEVLRGAPIPMSESNETMALGDVQVRGTPACQGKYRGVCRVVKHLSQANKIKAGTP